MIEHTHVNRRRDICAALSVLIVVALLGCGNPPPARSGESADPVLLSSVTAGGAGGVGGDVLEQLVAATSSSPVRVATPTLDPRSDDPEGEALAALRAGAVDVAVLRADTLASAGAASMAVLQLPLLIESVEHATRVAGGPLAEELLADLAAIDLVGLALVPGGLRHPFGYEQPLLGPGDYAGQVINTRVGDGVDAIIGALGATTDHSVDEARSAKARSGELRGIEVSLQQPMAVTLPAVVTSNVTLYTKFDVVVVRRDVWRRLSGGQRDELLRAARRAGDLAIAGRDSEPEGLNRWCATEGASSVIADATAVADLRRALQPVLDAAADDPELSPLIAGVAELGDGTAPAPGKVCGTPVAAAPATDGYRVEPVGPQDVLEGTWRLVVDRQTMIDFGASPQEAGANAGVWTFKVVGNKGDVDQPNGPNCTVEFTFNGNEFSLDWAVDGNDACYGLSAGTYELDGDIARLTFDRARDYDPALDNAMFEDGLQRVG